MDQEIHADICVIGAGSGGLSVAAGAAKLGARTVLIERHRMGGDCLNTGCVPSKSLLAAAHAAQTIRDAGRFGIQTPPPVVAMQAVHDHVHRVIAAIEPHDSQARFEGLGVTVLREHGRFLDPRTVQAGNHRIRARRFVLATGSRPAIPAIPGLEQTPFFTNETIFDNTAPLPHLIVLGGGPIGLELAQAHRRLGSEVTLLIRSRPLPKDDPELAALVLERLQAEGIQILTGLKFLAAAPQDGGVLLTVEHQGQVRRMAGSHLLVATGRRPNLDDLGLESAGIDATPTGITVDARLRTRNRNVFAIGDVIGGPLFTHVAGYHAGIVIRNALFRIPAKVDYRALPWVTYTDPELAQVGLTEAAARAAGHAVRILAKPFSENDRARAEGRTEGLLKVVVTPKGGILGASMAGPHAGELIQPWILAISQGLKIGAMATFIAPYPTLGEINKGAAGHWYTDSLFSPRTRKLVNLLSRLG